MIRSYIKVAVRNFWRDRFYSLVNLSGLALGLASVTLIIANIGYELSFDRHFSKSEQIFQLVLEDRQRDPIQQTVMVPDSGPHDEGCPKTAKRFGIMTGA